MKFSVFDIEANGLKPDKIHCLSVNNGKLRSTSIYENMRSFFSKAEVLVGHNIIRYDIPALERILDIKIKATLIDTLALSWYLEPDRPRHGLEEYGEEYGIPKPKVDDWDNLTTAEYIHRCEEDVKINTRLWQDQWTKLKKLYGSEEEALRFIAYLSDKMTCAREQEENRWKLDTERCKTVCDKLIKEKEDKLAELVSAMPKVPVYAEKKKPAKPYKKDGSLSAAGQDWFLFLENRGLPKDRTEPFKYIKDYIEPNPNSHDQIKAWLASLGWKPETFVYNRDKSTGEIRKIPQVQQEKTKGPGLCPSVKKLYAKEPNLEVLDGLSILTHRISILEGFLKEVDEDGYITASVGGLTNTLRFKHRILVNLPGVGKPYGEDIRGCLVADDGTELCGSDMSGLEDRLKQHYIYPHDPDYVNEMNKEDYDPHLDLALMANAVSDETVTKYKLAEDKDKDVKNIRHTYKQGNYACQYGAGVPRLMLTIGCNRATAENIYNTYWKRNWAINAVADEQVTKVCDGYRWLYNPVSRFWYSLRHEKDKFSTLVQGTAVYCFDLWLSHVRKDGPPIIGQFHDEFIARIKIGLREKCKKHIIEATKIVNDILGLNRELDCDVAFGLNYAEVH